MIINGKSVNCSRRREGVDRRERVKARHHGQQDALSAASRDGRWQMSVSGFREKLTDGFSIRDKF